MKRLLWLIMCMMLVLCCTACGAKEPEPETTEEVVEPTPEPTLEEILGFTAYDLMADNPMHMYQNVYVCATYSINEVNGNRTVEHQYKDSIAHEFDGTISRDILITTETCDGVEINRSETVWRNQTESMAYSLVNYDTWTYREMSDYGYYMYQTLSSQVSSDTFERNTVGLRVTGSSPALSDSSLDTAIKYFLGKFGVDRASYTFEAQYDFDTKELRNLTAIVTVPDEVTINDNRAKFNSMEVKVTPISGDEQTMISIPVYIRETAVAWVEPGQEPEVLAYEPLDTSVPVCVSMFGQEADYDIFCEFFRNEGYNPEKFSDASGLDGQAIFDGMTQLMVYLNYDGLLEYDLSSASDEIKWAYDWIMNLCEPRVNATQTETVPDEPAQTPEPDGPASNEPV